MHIYLTYDGILHVLGYSTTEYAVIARAWEPSKMSSCLVLSQEEATPQETPAAQEDAPAASEDAPIVA